jgi:hypothetical protein
MTVHSFQCSENEPVNLCVPVSGHKLLILQATYGEQNNAQDQTATLQRLILGRNPFVHTDGIQHLLGDLNDGIIKTFNVKYTGVPTFPPFAGSQFEKPLYLDMSKLTLKELNDLPIDDLCTVELSERSMRISAFESSTSWSDYLTANELKSPIVGKFAGLVPWPNNTPYFVEIVINEANFKGGTVSYPGLNAKGTWAFINVDEEGTVHYDETITEGAMMPGKVSLKLLESGDVNYIYNFMPANLTATLKRIPSSPFSSFSLKIKSQSE